MKLYLFLFKTSNVFFNQSKYITINTQAFVTKTLKAIGILSHNLSLNVLLETRFKTYHHCEK